MFDVQGFIILIIIGLLVYSLANYYGLTNYLVKLIPNKIKSSNKIVLGIKSIRTDRYVGVVPIDERRLSKVLTHVNNDDILCTKTGLTIEQAFISYANGDLRITSNTSSEDDELIKYVLTSFNREEVQKKILRKRNEQYNTI